MSKKLGQLSTHVPPEIEQQIKALAHQEGVSSSVYLLNIIRGHLDDLRSEYDRMKSIFEPVDQSSNRSMRSDGTE